MNWIQELLASWNAPLTSDNIAFLNAWASAEGQNSYYNPLNVSGTVGQFGSTGLFNVLGYYANGQPYGVLMFPNLQTGIQATAAWLEHGYGDVIAAFQSGNPSAYFASHPAASASFAQAWSYGVQRVEALLGNKVNYGGQTAQTVQSMPSDTSSGSTSVTASDWSEEAKLLTVTTSLITLGYFMYHAYVG